MKRGSESSAKMDCTAAAAGSAASGPTGRPAAARLAERYGAIRAATRSLCDPLSPEDCAVQSMADASPAKWHLAHTTWFFETFVLDPLASGWKPVDAAYRVLFNSYYNAVGEQYPRPRREMLTRPSLDEVLEYRARVDRGVTDLLEGPGGPPEDALRLVELGLHHEQQHQELILTDVKHLLAQNPLRPAYAGARAKASAPASTGAPAAGWHRCDEGVRWIGHDGAGFAFDNEGPRHRVFLDAFEVASRPVTNAEYLGFVEDRGYERPELWLAEGFDTVQRRAWRAPLYWERRDGAWLEMTLAGLRPLDPAAPVTHVSFYEADAFARWADARLPGEAEWEVAAAGASLEGNFAESGLLHPAPAGGARAGAPAQLFGDVWEWTQSAHAPYPGYRPTAGALGEYNAKFMCNQMVLRGGSCATPGSHIRSTYRNFFYPDARWQFSGARLARDAGR